MTLDSTENKLNELDLNKQTPATGTPAESGSESEGDAPDTAASSKKKKKKTNKKKKKGTQTWPPSIGLSKIYKPSGYPTGEVQAYVGDNAFRTTDAEKRHLEQMAAQEDPLSPLNYNVMRRGAEVHRETRKYAQEFIKPGRTLLEIANLIEDTERTLVEEDGFTAGVGFPTGLSLNNIAAHYTPNPREQDIVLKEGDILKVDFGPHVSGRITDSAFTMSFNPDYENLLKAVKAATNAGIKTAGIDVLTSEVGEAVQEVMESYEVEINGKVLPVKSIRNLVGHNIRPYVIHGGKSVPIVAGSDDGDRMEEGEVFAIETFGSTGRGYVQGQKPNSHYMRAEEVKHPSLPFPRAKQVLRSIEKNFGTLPFCKRYLARAGESDFDFALSTLVRNGVVREYPPLADEEGSMTAQFEHTILLRPTCKEVLTRGDDY